jgi:tRNA A-37 threonylcarbamoyl transferase component Bud32/tetratricopeptide (TPR) repeat protein
MPVYAGRAVTVNERCPSDDEIAGYVEHRLDETAVRDVERHLDTCDACRSVVRGVARAFLVDDNATNARTLGDDTIEDAPPTLDDPVDGPLVAGAKIARYVVIRELGRGGMGVVYEALDPELDRKVAVKVLRRDRLRADAHVASIRMQREARAMAKLAHPNVIIVHDVGAIDGGVFVAMELVKGTTLREWIDAARSSRTPRTPHGIDAILATYVAAGRGLAAAHAAGIVHRDFKPQNVLVTSDGDRVRVTDFGLARATKSTHDDVADHDRIDAAPRSGRPSLTETGAVVGTPAYMAPEQLRGEDATEQSDQFSFCVALWEAVHGERPFGGADAKELAQNVLEGKVRAPKSDARVPSAIDDLLLRGLRAEPRERHPSMNALLDALETQRRSRARRGRIVITSMASLAAIALVAVVVLLSRRTRSNAPTLCTGATAELAGTWDDATRENVHAAFLATGAPFAAAAWTSVASSLDAYARAWTAMDEESCASTRIRGVQSDAVFDLREACLSRRKSELRALVDVLSHADASAVEIAPKAVTSLTSVHACADVQALTAQTPLPDDPSLRTRIVDLRARIARANAMYETGKWIAAHKDAQAIVDEEKTIAWRPIEAEAKLALASMTSDDTKAQPLYLEAVTAAEAGRDDEVAARGWIALVRVATRRHAYDRAEEYSQRAGAALERLQGDASLRADLTDALGLLRFTLAHFDEAVALYRHELDLRGDVKTAPVEECLTRLGNTLLRVEDPAAARPVIERALDVARALYGENHREFALILNQLADVDLDDGKPQDALDAFTRAETIVTPVVDAPLAPTPPIDPDAELGEAFAPAVQLDIARGTAVMLLSSIVTGEGAARVAQHDWAGARAAYEKARARVEDFFGDKTTWMVPPLLGLGRVAREEGKLADARAFYEKALAIAEATDTSDPRAPAALLGIAETKLASKDATGARDDVERALAMLGDHGGTHLLRGSLFFAEARALWESSTSSIDHSRAVELARRAQTELAKTTALGVEPRAAVEAWLHEHA